MFCPYCGRELKDGKPCTCEEAMLERMQKKLQPPPQEKHTGLKILVGVLGAILAGLMIAIICAFIWRLSA